MKRLGRRGPLGIAVLLVAVVAVVLGLTLTGRNSTSARAADKRPPNPLTKQIVACQRSGKVICDPAVYRRNRAKGMFPLSKPDPKGARLLTVREVRPPSWGNQDYAAELMTYAQAQKIAPDLAGASSAVVNPSRKFWVLSLYHDPPIRVSDKSWYLSPGAAVRMIRVRVESRTVDALTGQASDFCINCAALRHPLRYYAVGVTLMDPLPGYRPPLSGRDALALLRRSGIAGSDIRGTPTVKLWTVKAIRLPRGGYPAWVITFHHTRPTSYGPAPVSQRADCAWVAIYNLQARVWTEDFQNCPDKRAIARSCASGCTPANQDALDAAADDAQSIAGSRYFTGAAVNTDANTVDLYLAGAPQSVIDLLDKQHPGVFVIHNDAPHTSAALLKLEAAFDEAPLQAKGIRVTEWGPTVDGYLQVGVTANVAIAQSTLDKIYGPNVIRVYKSQPITLYGLRFRSRATGFLVGAIHMEGGPMGESRRKGGGLATVFNSQGRAVAHERIRPGRDFRFRLAPGRYWLGFGRDGHQDRAGCPRRLITVHAGKTTHSDLSFGCDWR